MVEPILPTGRRKNLHSVSGFTIIELLIVIAVLALLTAIAVPSYQGYVLKARRTEAKDLLFTTAQRLQQYYTQNDVYTTNTTTLGVSTTSENGYYTLTIAAGHTGDPDTSYAVTATPVGGTSQAGDSACGNYTLNSLGTKTVSGSQSTPPCW